VKILTALVAAIAGPTFAFVGFAVCLLLLSGSADVYQWRTLGAIALATLAVAAAHVVLLGFPAFLLLKWKNLARGWTTTGAGLLLGALPMALFSWPGGCPGCSSSSNGVQTMVDGAPTAAGWLSYAYGVGFFATLGAIGGVCFWLVWRRGQGAAS
jgi:hypothetical protein